MEALTNRGLLLARRYMTRADEAIRIVDRTTNDGLRKAELGVAESYLELAKIELEWFKAACLALPMATELTTLLSVATEVT